MEKKNYSNNLISNKDEDDYTHQYLSFNKNSSLKARLLNKNSNLILSSMKSSTEANEKIKDLFNLGIDNDKILKEILDETSFNNNLEDISQFRKKDSELLNSNKYEKRNFYDNESNNINPNNLSQSNSLNKSKQFMNRNYRKKYNLSEEENKCDLEINLDFDSNKSQEFNLLNNPLNEIPEDNGLIDYMNTISSDFQNRKEKHNNISLSFFSFQILKIFR